MRTVGHRKHRQLSFTSSAELLAEGARFNDEIHKMPTGQTTRIRKGVYRFMTHEEANRQQLDALVENVAHAAAGRR
jgi:threonine aldolase